MTINWRQFQKTYVSHQLHQLFVGSGLLALHILQPEQPFIMFNNRVDSPRVRLFSSKYVNYITMRERYLACMLFKVQNLAPFQTEDHISMYDVTIPTVKIRLLWDRLFFITEIPILVRQHFFYIKAAPGLLLTLLYTVHYRVKLNRVVTRLYFIQWCWIRMADDWSLL